MSILSHAQKALDEAVSAYQEITPDTAIERKRGYGVFIVHACDRALFEASRIAPSVPASQQNDLASIRSQAESLKVTVGQEVFLLSTLRKEG